MAKQKFERTKPHVNIGTIGHIDHGKTVLTSAITKVLAAKGQSTAKSYEEIAKGGAVRDKSKILTIAVAHVEPPPARLFLEVPPVQILFHIKGDHVRSARADAVQNQGGVRFALVGEPRHLLVHARTDGASEEEALLGRRKLARLRFVRRVFIIQLCLER